MSESEKCMDTYRPLLKNVKVRACQTTAGAVALLLCLLTVLMSCTEPNRGRAYDVYAAVLSDFPTKRSPIVICSMTILPLFSTEALAGERRDHWQLSSQVADRLEEFIPELEPATLENFRARNSGPIPIDGSRLSVHGVRVTDSACSPSGRLELEHQFVELSAVGFGRDKKSQALVYMGVLDTGSSRGWFVLLQREEGEWSEVRRVQAWIA